MQTVLPSQLRRGMVLILDGAPHAVEEVLVAGTGQAKHRVHAQLRHLASGHHSERGFLDGDHQRVVAAKRGFTTRFAGGTKWSRSQIL
jgi:translation elongation factor P/translation initiation factor 5A